MVPAIDRNLQRIVVCSSRVLILQDVAVTREGPEEIIREWTVRLRRVLVAWIESRVHRDRIQAGSQEQMTRERADIRRVNNRALNLVLDTQAEVHSVRQLVMTEHRGQAGWTDGSASLSIRIQIAIGERRRVGDGWVSGGSGYRIVLPGIVK